LGSWQLLDFEATRSSAGTGTLKDVSHARTPSDVDPWRAGSRYGFEQWFFYGWSTPWRLRQRTPPALTITETWS
jgi:hypothetical protein